MPSTSVALCSPLLFLTFILERTWIIGRHTYAHTSMRIIRYRTIHGSVNTLLAISEFRRLTASALPLATFSTFSLIAHAHLRDNATRVDAERCFSILMLHRAQACGTTDTCLRILLPRRRAMPRLPQHIFLVRTSGTAPVRARHSVCRRGRRGSYLPVDALSPLYAGRGGVGGGTLRLSRTTA